MIKFNIKNINDVKKFVEDYKSAKNKIISYNIKSGE